MQYVLKGPLNTKVYCDPASANARLVFKKMRVQFVPTPAEANLLWLRRGYSRALNNLLPHQSINHLPGERTLIDKDALARALNKFALDPTALKTSSSDFFPETFCLSTREEIQRFEAFYQGKNTKVPWIVKPADLSQGEGVRIFDQPKELRSWLNAHSANRQLRPEDSGFIVQRYLTRPLLLDDRKSELRIYFLVLSLSPLRVLLCNEGTVRLNTLPFKLEDWNNPLVHITNVYQQKKHADYDPSVVLKWSFSDLESNLCERGKANPGFIQRVLMPKLKTILEQVLRATQQTITRQPKQGHCFALFGADIILDDQLNPWLTEVQKGPGLSLDDPVKRDVLPAMLAESLVLAEAARLKTLLPQTVLSLDNFEWVINDETAMNSANAHDTP